MIRTFLLFFVMLSGVIFSQNKLNIIPYPQKVNVNEGSFTIPNVFLLDKSLPKDETEYLKKRLVSEVKFQNSSGKDANLVYSQLPKSNNSALNNESYTLEINPKQIHIKSYTKEGYFRALQTLI